jgi:hypothetical protein
VHDFCILDSTRFAHHEYIGHSNPHVYRIQVDQRFSSGIRDVRYT